MELDKSLIQDIASIWRSARTRAYTLVNRAMIDAYWSIGQRIFHEELKGQKKADYGSYLLRELAKTLTQELDKHLDERELRRMRQFHQLFPDAQQLRPELTWSHYRLLLRVEDDAARTFYLTEAASESWSTRQLERNIQSLYYHRLLTARAPDAVSATTLPVAAPSPRDFVKDPYVLEFLSLDLPASFSENELEGAILAELQHFLLEMGKGFAFVARQYAIKTTTRQYFIDLVFYNYLLKCFVLIDLKITELTHQDIGQMDMYVRMFEDLKKMPGDNPTIGLILCSEKDDTLIRYSVLEGNEQLFASRYKTVLPTRDELTQLVQQGRQLFEQKQP